MTSSSAIDTRGSTPFSDLATFIATLEKDTLIVEQYASEIRADRRSEKATATLTGLRLGKIRRISVLRDDKTIRGMIAKYPNLVRLLDRNNLDQDAFDRIRKARLRPLRRDGEISASYLQGKINTYLALMETNKLRAAQKAGRILAIVRKRPKVMELDDAPRREVSDLTRTMYRAMFGDDQAVARQAAYCLVASSQVYGKGLDPEAKATHLKHAEAVKFRRGLLGLLGQSGVKCFTSIKAEVSDKTVDELAIVKITLHMNRALPFTIEGRDVELGGADHLRVKRDRFVIGCPLAERVVSVDLKTDVVGPTKLSAEAEFAVPQSVLASGQIPISVMMPGIFENRVVDLLTPGDDVGP